MRQRLLLDDDEKDCGGCRHPECTDCFPRKRGSPELARALKHLLPAEEAISDDPLILLSGMQTVMFMPSPGKQSWHARAKGAQDFGQGDTPMEAMTAAMRLKRRAT